MMRMFPKALAAMLLAVPLLAVPAARAEEAARHFLFHITTEDSWAAGSALTQASVASELGHEVTILLNVRGVHLAEKDAAQSGFSVTARTPREVLAMLIARGHRVLVCGMCMVAGGVETEDLIEGAVVSGPELTFGALGDPGAIILSY